MALPTSPNTSRLRLTILLIVVGCLFIALFARLWFLQVINVSVAKKQVQTSGVVTVYTAPPRGEILDRKGRVLVNNINVPVIEVQRQYGSDTGMVRRLSALIGIPVKALTAAIESVQYNSFDYVPVYQHASPAQILYVQEHSSLFPGVTATTVAQRHVTALGQYAAALLGYVGPVDATELKTLSKHGVRAGDLVGQAGAEAEFQDQLQGRPGVTRIQIDSTGQELGVLSSTPPVPGRNLRLTISGPLQKVAVEAMRTEEKAARQHLDTVTHRNFQSPGGSVVVEDPNGQLLALATNPSYNPNLFDNGGISAANYKRITSNSISNQLGNRPIQGQYAPGSTFKLATATAGLKTGIRPYNQIYDDAGHITVGGTVLSNDNGAAYGPIDLTQAITVSSDIYFNSIGVELWDGRAKYGQTALQKVADSYGLSKPTGIDLPNEAGGVIPTPASYAAEAKLAPKVYGKTQPWYSGDSAHTAIGQGQVLVTPLQLANAYATFANGGTVYHPRVALDSQTAKGKVVKTYRPSVAGHSARLTAAQHQAMLQGFVGVVNNPQGTAYGDFGNTSLSGEDIAGKTGTAQVTGAGKQDTSVFTSFAPASSPKYVVDCFLEDSGYGASAAAPVVRAVYDKIFNKPITQPTYGGATGIGGQN